jgi:hypothetical protein
MKGLGAALVASALLSSVVGSAIPDVSARQAAPQLAFPEADGFGRYAVGGRYGTVYKVTNLNDSGPGSLRDAVSKPNRIVIFTVDGVINIKSRIVVSKKIHIAGQTAPGKGISVYGNGWSFSNADDAIVRHIRIRMGKGGDSGKDAVTIAEGSRMIFQHVSVSWGRDETFSISGTASNITVSDSIIAQGLETHSCGGLVETSGGVSLFRNLYIDNNTRNPKVKGINDFQNNVVYNWGKGGGYIAGDSDGASYANVVNNYFMSGPSTTVPAITRGNQNFRAYVKNNFHDSNRNGKVDGTALCEDKSCYTDIAFQSKQFDYPAPQYLMSPLDAFHYVLSFAGVWGIRDTVDNVLITEARSYGVKGSIIADEKAMGGPGQINASPAFPDADNDGLPDYYEIANGLNPNDPSDAMKIAANGYTNLENWINEL